VIASLRLMAIASLVLFLPAPRAQPADTECSLSGSLAHTFDSGTSWSACAHIDPLAGLVLRDVHYRAPGDRERSVLTSIGLGQLLMHWHDENLPELRIGGQTDTTRGLGGSAAVALTDDTCNGTLTSVWTLAGSSDSTSTASADDTAANSFVCARERPTGLLARHVGRPAIQGEAWEVFAVARQGLLTWRLGMSFGEDGRLEPSVELSGHNERESGATLLATWRMAFALDGDADDWLEEFEFRLDETLGNRRPMSARPLLVESFRQVNRERFRGWRISDLSSGAGYYLDPLDSAQSWTDRSRDWARFDLAVTRANACERLADANPGTLTSPGDSHDMTTGAPDASGAAGTIDATNTDTAAAAAAAAADCGTNLDEFVNGESLNDAPEIIWFSRTRNWLPRPEDQPFISSVRIAMELLPFDWTTSSPFEDAP